MQLSKARTPNRITSLLFLCLLLSPACLFNRSKHKYFYPDGYIGWTRINFKKDAPMPPMEDGAYIFKFTPAGELDISTEFRKVESGYPIHEYYYYTDNMQYKRISATSVGGFNIQKKEDMDRGDYETHQSYQFVGSYEEYQKYRDRFRDKNDNAVVGLVKKDQVQSH